MCVCTKDRTQNHISLLKILLGDVPYLYHCDLERLDMLVRCPSIEARAQRVLVQTSLKKETRKRAYGWVGGVIKKDFLEKANIEWDFIRGVKKVGVWDGGEEGGKCRKSHSEE